MKKNNFITKIHISGYALGLWYTSGVVPKGLSGIAIFIA